MFVVREEDLYFGKKGALAKLRARFLMSLLGLNRLNKNYSKACAEMSDKSFTQSALDVYNISVSVDQAEMAHIPADGACIVIANHPTGALDGMVLINELTKVRSDLKVLGNFMLERFEPLKHYFLSVDVFEGEDAAKKNLAPLRSAKQHLEQGGMLLIFPAGEVATYQKGSKEIADRPWPTSIIKFIKNANVGVLPICIECSNSRLFHWAGKIHPMLRTALLPHELNNKRNGNVKLRIGTVISARVQKNLPDLNLLRNYLRASVTYLIPQTIARVHRKALKRQYKHSGQQEIIPAVSTEIMNAELSRIRDTRKLMEYGDFEIFFASAEEIPMIMTEIGRLREITFREIGEGTHMDLDTDTYDRYYHQMFIWDRKAMRIVGAYRMGLGGEIMKRYGLEGFYTNSLFKMCDDMGEIMARTIELGRSFIVHDYQRKPITLMLLWKGILYVLLKHVDYRYLTGPVTISGEFQDASKQAIVTFLRNNHFDSERAACIKAINGFRSSQRIDTSLLDGLTSMDLLNRLVTDIEGGKFSVPVLVRKYLQLGCKVLSFNTDYEFQDALDSLILLDLKQVPADVVAMLTKELSGDIDVMARFRNIT